MKNIMNILISIALGSFSISCAKKNKNTPPTSALEESAKTADSVKTTSDIIYKNIKIGEISQLEISQDEIEKQIAQYKKRTLNEVKTPTALNVSVYKSDADGNTSYTIAPKVFAYGLLDSSHKSKEANGYIAMQMNISLIDGMNPHLHDEANTLIIPEGLRLKNHESLRQDIAALEHEKIDSIDVLSGCPTRIVVATADLSYDITPANIADKSFCQVNTSTDFEFKIPEDVADKIFLKALPANGVNIKVDYAIKYFIETKKFQLVFDKVKLLNLIKTLTNDNKSSNGEDKLTPILYQILHNSKIADSLSDSFNEQINTIVLKTHEALKDIQTLAKNELSLNWNANREFSTDTVISMSSKLKQVRTEEAFFGRDPQFGTNTNADFTNLNRNNIYSMNLVPQRGQWIEFQPTMYLWERRKRDAEAHIFRDAKLRCRPPQVRGCLTYNVQDKFTQEYTGNDVWVKNPDPLANWTQSLSQLKLFFHFSNGESFTCNMDELDLQNSQITTMLKINNTKRCPLFNSERTVIISFGMINALNLGEFKYITGERFTSLNFEEENHNTYKESTYSPEVRLAGKLKLIGQSFISDSIKE